MKIILKRLGYIKDQKGILNRYLREKEGWDVHLNKTRHFIINCLGDAENGKVAILGSGWLLDVPINELLEKFKQVNLYDIIHPNKIKNQFKKQLNINFIQTDLTGGLVNEIYAIVKGKTKVDLNKLQPANDYDFSGYDFVISLNLLNQLDILLKENLLKYGNYSREELNLFSKKIQENHVNILPKGKTCLITDYTEYLYDEKNRFVNSNELVFINFPESKKEDEWEWAFDTKMTYYPKRKTVFRVKAMLL